MLYELAADASNYQDRPGLRMGVPSVLAVVALKLLPFPAFYVAVLAMYVPTYRFESFDFRF